jgi:phage terminase small subunit
MVQNVLTQKQENFCVNIVSGMTQRDAWINAGYSGNYPVASIDSNACTLANETKIQQRIQELRDKAVASNPKIMSVTARLERLSQIASEDIRSPKGTPIRGPNIQAITEHNKMEHIYDVQPTFNDNRTLNIVVADEKTKENVHKLLTGVRREDVQRQREAEGSNEGEGKALQE